MGKLLWCFLILVSFSNMSDQKGMHKKAFVFPTASDNSYVSLNAQLKKPLKAFTVCLYVYTDLSTTRGYSIFSYATEEQFDEILLFWSKDIGYSFSVGGDEIIFKVSDIPVDPTHLCASWESITGIAELWVDGKPMVRKSVNKGYILGSEASIILGQDQDSFGGSFEEQQSLVGDIGDVNMWDFALSPREINTVYAGGKFSPNVLDWRELTYQVHGEVYVKPQLWS